jgi:DNA-binding transcriptional LysR family regulator
MEKQRFAELSAFAAVVKRQSFAKAAADLGVSPSALSQTIRRLERELGARLLNRTTRSVAPTAEGERLAARITPLLAELDSSVSGVGERGRKPSGVVRVNAPRYVVLQIFAPHLARFREHYPEIVLDITSDDSYADIVAGRFDVGIRLGERLARDMLATRLGPDHQVAVVASPRYVSERGVPQAPRELREHACVNWRSPSTGAASRWEFQRGSRRFDVEVEGPLVSNDSQVLLRAALDGLGLAYLTTEETSPHVERGRLVRCLEAWSPRFSGFHFYYPHRQEAGSPVRAFVNFFREAAVRRA